MQILFGFKFPLQLLLVLGSLLAVVSPALAGNDDDGYVPAEEVQVTTPVYHADVAAFRPKLGVYEYRVSWEGIGAAHLWINVERQGELYRVSTVAKTNRFIDVFYKMRYAATGLLSAADFLPVKSVMEAKENSRERRSEVLFLPNGTIKSTYWRNGRGTEEKSFDPNNFMLDPFSAAFIARSLPWQEGLTRTFDTFNGKTRYLIELTAVRRESIEVNGKRRPVWVISPKVKKLTAKNPPEKLREAKIYITDDESREILKIVSEVFIGDVSTKLVSFKPAVPAGDAQIARAVKAEPIHLR